jgi:hypothetical protein
MNNLILLFTSAGFSEYGNEPSGSIKYGELLTSLAEWLSAYLEGVRSIECVI